MDQYVIEFVRQGEVPALLEDSFNSDEQRSGIGWADETVQLD